MLCREPGKQNLDVRPAAPPTPVYRQEFVRYNTTTVGEAYPHQGKDSQSLRADDEHHARVSTLSFFLSIVLSLSLSLGKDKSLGLLGFVYSWHGC